MSAGTKLARLVEAASLLTNFSVCTPTCGVHTGARECTCGHVSAYRRVRELIQHSRAQATQSKQQHAKRRTVPPRETR